MKYYNCDSALKNNETLKKKLYLITSPLKLFPEKL